MIISMANGDEEKVIWKDIRELAKKTDYLYNSVMHGTGKKIVNKQYDKGRKDDAECVHAVTKSSYLGPTNDGGIPNLMDDIAAPFKVDFPIRATLYQRWEFAYHLRDKGKMMYPEYLAGKARPIYHSEYLVSSYDAPANAGLTVEQLAKQLKTDWENTYSLIEMERHYVSIWWPNCQHLSEDKAQVSAELYFVTYPDSVCPCPAVYRVAFSCINGGNGNGNGTATFGPNKGFKPYSGYGVIHPEWAEGGEHRHVTLEQLDWEKLHPENDQDAHTSFNEQRGIDPAYPDLYPPPPSCCAKIEFPKLGAEAGVEGRLGGTKTTMYDDRLFYPGYMNAETKPFTPRIEAIPFDEYELRKARGDLPPHCWCMRPNEYDKYSKHEMWKMCNENVEAGIRVTSMAFGWYKEMVDGYGWRYNIPMVSIVWVPTAVTLKLDGTFQPAIRKHWYDMIYYKLRHIIGCYPPANYVPKGSADEGQKPTNQFALDYPHGTTWDAETELELQGYDQPCSRYLALGCGWQKHHSAQFVKQAFYGEKFFEQFLCVKNYAGSITCPGSGDYNDSVGCFCSEEHGRVDDCRDLACKRPIVPPWDGGCLNTTCGDGEQEHYATHKASVDYLNKLAAFIEEHKIPEPTPDDGIINILNWRSCALKYEPGSEQRLRYSFIGGTMYEYFLPFEPIHIENTYEVGPPSTPTDSYHTTGTFVIPDGCEGELSLFLDVEDWGTMRVLDDQSATVAEVNLSYDPTIAGPQGGCTQHSGTASAHLKAGTYTYFVDQENITYSDPNQNRSYCAFKLDVEPTPVQSSIPSSFISTNTISYPRMRYDELGCSGCEHGLDCPIYVHSQSNAQHGAIILNPQRNAPVVSGMAWATMLHGYPASNHILNITGDISNLLVQKGKYKIIGNPDKPCAPIDAEEDPDHPTILPSNPGGKFIIKVHYGPVGTTMRKASKVVEITNEPGAKLKLNENFNLDFTPTEENGITKTLYQYRFTVVVYIEAWPVGEGDNNPWVLLSADNGCFQPMQTKLDFKID